MYLHLSIAQLTVLWPLVDFFTIPMSDFTAGSKAKPLMQVGQYQVGMSPPSFDKQFVRDYLETLDWGKVAPPPTLPDDIVRQTSEKYREALERLTGITL